MKATSNSKTEARQSLPRHPFGELLAQHRARKPGLTQTRLAELAGYDQSILVRMSQGKKDLTGPSGRERAVRLIETLAEQGALTTMDEANALLLAADMPPLFERQPSEARLITRLSRMPAGQRTRRTNLPAPLTSFIGRAHEIAEVRRLLSLTRLLTLTGAGGCGKTRLAQRVAADVLISYTEGVWYAELAALTDSTLIADLVVRALGLMASDRPAVEQLNDFLRERQILLVLDNCEHLIEAVALFALEVLRACPRVTILTTSREALNVDGEMAWRVPPMQPDEAGRLFVDRALAVRSGTVLSSQDDTVAHICQRLDGMPLAIELAAARLSALSLSDIAARLDDRFNLLAHGRRGALPRHQTLRALIDWSYELLSEPEKIVFRRLGVFVGGWTLDQAEQIVALESDSEPLIVLALLSQLVAKSLITISANQGGNRYRFLETIREYAKERLAESGEMIVLRNQHAEVFARKIGISARLIDGADQKEKLDRIQSDYENLESALEWSFQDGNNVVGCSLVSGLVSFWDMRTRSIKQAIRWTQRARHALSDQIPLLVQAGVWVAISVFLSTDETTLNDAQQVLRLYELADDQEGIALGKTRVGQILFWSNHKAEGTQMLHESLALARDMGETGAWLVRLSLGCLGGFAEDEGDLEQAESYLQESMRQYQAVSDLSGIADMLFMLSNLAHNRHQIDIALQLTEEALSASQQLEDVYMEARARCRIAELLRLMGDCHAAEICVSEGLKFARANTDELQCACAMIVAAKIALCLNHPDDAYLLFRESLKLLLRAANIQKRWVSAAIAGLVWDADRSHQCMRSVRLLGVIATLKTAFPANRPNPMDLDITHCVSKARAALGDAAYEAAYAEGRAMPLEQAIAYALNN